eukprot:3932840-Rhodomonas_salina.5
MLHAFVAEQVVIEVERGERWRETRCKHDCSMWAHVIPDKRDAHQRAERDETNQALQAGVHQAVACQERLVDSPSCDQAVRHIYLLAPTTFVLRRLLSAFQRLISSEWRGFGRDQPLVPRFTRWAVLALVLGNPFNMACIMSGFGMNLHVRDRMHPLLRGLRSASAAAFLVRLSIRAWIRVWISGRFLWRGIPEERLDNAHPGQCAADPEDVCVSGPRRPCVEHGLERGVDRGLLSGEQLGNVRAIVGHREHQQVESFIARLGSVRRRSRKEILAQTANQRNRCLETPLSDRHRHQTSEPIP